MKRTFNNGYFINRSQYDAVLFDLDGVITKTADIHIIAWERLFNDFLKIQKEQNQQEVKKDSTSDDRPALYRPFDVIDDYRKYVDGKPRYDGIQGFLDSRGIKLPLGCDDDLPSMNTIYGLGKIKNRIFKKLIKKGVDVYHSSVDLIEQLKLRGFKVAVVSSSRNCMAVLRSANISHIFDIKVDGVDRQRLDLKGKPHPDTFLAAADQLEIPAGRCVVIEDAAVGVEAGKRGSFGLVVGVNRGDFKSSLLQAGADFVVDDLSEIRVKATINTLSGMFDFKKSIYEKMKDKDSVLFINYDTTLTRSGAAPHTEGAWIDEHYRDILIKLSSFCSIVIISKEEPETIRKKIAVDGICYAGGRDFRIYCYEVPNNFIDKSNLDTVLELHSDPGGDMGKAVEFLIDALAVCRAKGILFYLGAGVSDEDAFAALPGFGLGLVVGEGERETAAHYRLNNMDEVKGFLNWLAFNFKEGNTWSLVFDDFCPESEKHHETLCALGNGYFVTRGALAQATACQNHYPGTYLAGCYNKLSSKVRGQVVMNEDLVNLPNWLTVNFRIEGGKWFDLSQVKILFHRQELDMERGVLHRTIRFHDEFSRETRFTERRLVSMHNMHLAALEIVLTPINYSGTVEIQSVLNADVKNKGVQRYRGLKNTHLIPISEGESSDNVIQLHTKTNQSRLNIVIAARTKLSKNDQPAEFQKELIREKGHIEYRFKGNIYQNEPLRIEKTISLFTSRDHGISECSCEATTTLHATGGFAELYNHQTLEWQHIWRRFEIKLGLTNPKHDYPTRRILRLYTFHLLQTVSKYSIDFDVGMPARGWHGEAYRGHIFWDELMIFPFLNYRMPQITRSLIYYRYRRLFEARQAAAAIGCKGAMYPWQSGSNGREESQRLHYNPRSQRWIRDNTWLQRHINAAIVYNIHQYFQVSGDLSFLAFYGAELLLEIANFFSTLATWNPEIERYEILAVMGPDEYHDRYPDAEAPGINNNSYTNIMVVFVMIKALELQEILPATRLRELYDHLHIEKTDLERWESISRKMKVVFHGDSIISQFEGYEDLLEFDWDRYRRKYKNIQRLDRILEAEGDSVNRYQISKQADVLMLFYLFSSEELSALLNRLGYSDRFEHDTIPKNIHYYMKRTCNGSSLSRVIDSWVRARSDREASWDSFLKALRVDIDDIQGGTTSEGIHLGAMAGCSDIIQRCYTGLETRDDILFLNPRLPKELNSIKLNLRYRCVWLDLHIGQKHMTINSLACKAQPIKINVCGKVFSFEPGESREVFYDECRQCSE